jgi:hypothetical protein
MITSTLLMIVIAYLGLMAYGWTRSNSVPVIRRWFDEPASRPALMTTRNSQPCPGAPFMLPSDGFIGLLWNDPVGPYSIFNRHSGIDIFGNGQPGEIPVYAAYDGHLTRLADWLATVIIRHDDPLHPGQAIWTYYTHMASRYGRESYIVPNFPPDTHGLAVAKGTLLGYQGEYAGENARPVGLHVHFSIVTSEADGTFKNEAWAANTLDPSLYLGMTVNIGALPARPVSCQSR